MTPTHLLDTSVYSQPLRKTPLKTVEARWRSLGDERLSTSVICEAELLTGLVYRDSVKLWSAYEAILKDRLAVLEVTTAVAENYSRIAGETMRRGTPRPAFDLLIAATARTHRLIVATCNVRHFTGLDGVAVEDWSR